MNPLKKLASDTALYGLSSVVGRLLNYLLFPLHQWVFPASNYGIITELYVYTAFLLVVYTFGMETGFFRFVNKYKDSEGKITDKDVYNTSFTVVLLVTGIISLLLGLMDTHLVEAMKYPGKEHFIWIFLGIISLDAIQSIPYARIRHEQKARFFAKAKLTGIFVNIFLNLFFLGFCYSVYKEWVLVGMKPFIMSFYNPAFNLEYVFIANLIGSLASTVFIGKYFTDIRLRINRDLFVPLFRFSYPIIFTGLALVTNEMLSRSAIKYWLPEGMYAYTNQQILGIFGGVFKLAIPMNMAIQAYRYAAEPFFFSQAQEKDSPQTFSKLLNYFVILGCILWIGISVNLEIFKYLLGNEDYRSALFIVPILLVGSLFAGVNYNLSAWYKLIDRTQIGTKITLIGAGITVAGNYILIPLFGYVGSAIAFVGAYFGMSVISYLWSRRLNPIPYQTGKLIFFIVLAGGLLGIFMYLNLTAWAGLAFGNGILLVYVLIIWFIEKSSIKRTRD